MPADSGERECRRAAASGERSPEFESQHEHSRGGRAKRRATAAARPAREAMHAMHAQQQQQHERLAKPGGEGGDGDGGGDIEGGGGEPRAARGGARWFGTLTVSAAARRCLGGPAARRLLERHPLGVAPAAAVWSQLVTPAARERWLPSRWTLAGSG